MPHVFLRLLRVRGRKIQEFHFPERSGGLAFPPAHSVLAPSLVPFARLRVNFGLSEQMFGAK
jgi:hypothetical protein